MRIRARHQLSGSSKINVTPLIDVVMVLIVFYLIVGKLASDRAAAVQLPGSGVGAASDSAGVVITVAAESSASAGASVFIDGVNVPAGGLVDALRAKLVPDAEGLVRTPVQVRADRRLVFSAVEPVIDACKKAGVTTLKLATQREDAGTSSGTGGETSGGKKR
jgi:biopolymer transport protein ExbD